MNARQKAKNLKKQIRTLESDNDLMRRIIADSPTMQELYDAYNKPLNITRTTMQFQEVDEISNCIAMIVNEPPATPQPKAEQKWIPVSEMLPDYGVSVLTWDGDCYCVEKRIPYIRDEDGEPISSDWWVSDEYDECDSDYYPNLRDGACIAWMPLPELYKAESEE